MNRTEAEILLILDLFTKTLGTLILFIGIFMVVILLIYLKVRRYVKESGYVMSGITHDLFHICVKLGAGMEEPGIRKLSQAIPGIKKEYFPKVNSTTYYPDGDVTDG